MILTDAEYAQLTQAEKTQYWRRRFEDLVERWDDLRAETDMLKTVLNNIQNNLHSINWWHTE